MPTTKTGTTGQGGAFLPSYDYSPTGRWSFGNIFDELAVDNVTALAGGGQTGATQILGQTARITTVATAGDSVMLPPSEAGMELLLINHGANPMQVFGSGTDQIDDQASATGVSQMQNSLVIYTCATAGNWYSEGLATGFGGPGLQTLSSVDNLVAVAGGAQGQGPTINRMVSRFTTGGVVTLPTSKAGMQLILINATAATTMTVFPAAGDTINALGVNAGFSLAAGKTAQFYCVTAGQWHTILSA